MLGLKIPCRGSPEAPSFSGCPEDLQSYFDDIIDFCGGFSHLDGLEHIKFALKYVPFESADLWSHLTESSNGDWDCFTSEVVQLYPELEESCRDQFFRLRSAFKGSDTVSISSLGKYFRSYCHYLALLVKQKKPSSHVASAFFDGFPPRFRCEVLKHLDSPSQRVTVSGLMSSVKHILALRNGIWKSSRVNSLHAQPSRASDNHSPRHSYSFCFFCGLSGHIQAGCHLFKSYLALGKCLLVNGCVVLPTGLEIPREVAR
ncbi:hypothetical protein M404DRAFT_167322 [Pisolithus tinctorius Marx 270]|uniref:CCHC-type domain-containing protein n=1 Tax=Pisolithus tinctorius Marx 270 TaxID=870435 RepID=A0A0C3N112_PISTI|nr:hypothetical protein M404DRAFT_167322 [Pisolithus tinctorius Marx 270]